MIYEGIASDRLVTWVAKLRKKNLKKNVSSDGDSERSFPAELPFAVFLSAQEQSNFGLEITSKSASLRLAFPLVAEEWCLNKTPEL